MLSLQNQQVNILFIIIIIYSIFISFFIILDLGDVKIHIVETLEQFEEYLSNTG